MDRLSADPPAILISLAVSAAFPLCEIQRICAPVVARSSAAAFPIPLPAPVMTIVSGVFTDISILRRRRFVVGLSSAVPILELKPHRPTSSEVPPSLVDGAREGSYGQDDYTPTALDRFNLWLSIRQSRRWIPDSRGLTVGDFGCGFDATFARGILDQIGHAVLVDLALAPDLKIHPKVRVVEGAMPEALADLPPDSFDAVMCISVLEHIWDPAAALVAIHRLLKPSGICLINVPSWPGKRVLEFLAFRLGTSPASEMNDHKMYYNPLDLWPVLVRAGFRPQDVQCFFHKCWMCTFAVCRKKPA